ncbi:MAG TPA: hypothetical protein VED17_01890 [Nitrososphaerales archaeon]|nr:hypothetical protein [Nitrososphaerales archaeon]
MIDIQSETSFEISDPFVVGDRHIFIVSWRVSMKSGRLRGIFGTMVSPTCAIVIESKARYGFSLETGEALDLDDFFHKNWVVKKKLDRLSREFNAERSIISDENF